MATFSEGFLSQLGRPAMSQSLFDLGSAIGGVPGQMKQQRKQQEFNQLMQQIQGAQGSGDFTSMKILAQQLATTNPQEAAKVMQAALAGEVKQQQQKQTTNVSKGQQALTTFATARGMNLATPQAKEGFFRIAKTYQVPPEKAFEIYNQFATTGVTERTTKGETVVRDKDGNLFTRATQYDEQGNARVVITPYNEGDVIVSGTTGTGGLDRPGLAGQTTEEQKFNEARVAAVVQLPSLRRSSKNIREAIDLLESGDVTTGGFVRRMSRGLTDFLGKTPKDIGEFETRLGDIVLARLESFTGAISDGERKFLIDQIGSYQASGESNLGRLKVLLEQAEDLMRDGVALATAEDFTSYQRSLTQPDFSFIPEAERQEAMEAFQRGEVSVQELRGMY
jgi:hypothetical protein